VKPNSVMEASRSKRTQEVSESGNSKGMREGELYRGFSELTQSTNRRRILM
jgi:hypothetical protein